MKGDITPRRAFLQGIRKPSFSAMNPNEASSSEGAKRQSAERMRLNDQAKGELVVIVVSWEPQILMQKISFSLYLK